MINETLKQAILLHQQDQLEKAEKIYNEILKFEPKNIDILHLIGILKAQQQDYHTAFLFISHALTISPNSAVLHNSIGNILKNLCEYENALQHYKISLKLSKNIHTYNNIGLLLKIMGRLKEAKENFYKIIELQPNNVDVHCILGALLLQENNYDEALTYLSKAILLDNKNFLAHKTIAQIYYKKNKIDLALNHYQKAARINKHDLDIMQNLGALWIEKNKLNVGNRYLKRILEMHPKNEEVLYNLGISHIKSNQFEFALKYFSQLLSLGNKEFNTYYNLGVIYQTLNRYDDAIVYFLEALKAQPNNVESNINLGALYLQKENFKQAQHHYEETLKYTDSKSIKDEIEYILNTLKLNKLALENKNLNRNFISQNNSNLINLLNNNASQPHISEKNDLPTHAPKQYIENLFNNYSNHYDKHLKLLEYLAPDLMLKFLLDYKILESGKLLKIIDLGCGTGLFGEKLKSFASKLIGVDLSQNMIAVAKCKSIYEELFIADNEKFLLKYCDINLITAIDVFPYTGKLENIFENCRKALHVNGHFVFTIEKLNNEKFNYWPQNTLRFSHNTGYINFLAKKNHFKIVFCETAKTRKQHNNYIECEFYGLQKI